MNRRDLISFLGLTAVTWPRSARAQQGSPMRRIGILQAVTSSAATYRAAFDQGLRDLGWTEGRNMTVDLRSAGEDADRLAINAAELVASRPEVILTDSSASVAVLPSCMAGGSAPRTGRPAAARFSPSRCRCSRTRLADAIRALLREPAGRARKGRRQVAWTARKRMAGAPGRGLLLQP
jgi:hypothetical protein